MKLRDITTGLHAAADIARAGENLFGSLDRNRRMSLGQVAPVLLAVGIGVGLGALIFSKEARERVSEWLASNRDKREVVAPARPTNITAAS